MATPKEEYFMDMLDSLLEHNHRHGTPLSSKKRREAVIRVMEDEEKDAKFKFNNVNMDNFFSSLSLSTHKRNMQT